MLAIVHAIKKRRPYPMGRHFKVKMDHDNLKLFLEQYYLEKNRKNGSQICWVMTLTSSREKGIKFLLLMHSQERMRMWNHCFVIFLLSN